MHQRTGAGGLSLCSLLRLTSAFHLFSCRNIVLKLHQESTSALNTITSYGDGFVAINLERHEGSVIVILQGPVERWPVTSFDALTPEDFDALVKAAPEVVIFGSGSRLRFPHPRLTAQLAKHRIGVETMDFGAACRTYNILMQEGRKVAAALLIEA
ncbi:putative membrane protein [Candidatus Burkholderia humilis]|nr:putative membrane protein [Candidatus Burkholderia humilis]